MIYQYDHQYREGGFTGDWMFQLPFEDTDQIAGWAFEGVAWHSMNKVISGKEDNLFDPKSLATALRWQPSSRSTWNKAGISPRHSHKHTDKLQSRR